jgi:hypothetical protein
VKYEVAFFLVGVAAKLAFYAGGSGCVLFSVILGDRNEGTGTRKIRRIVSRF